MLRCCDCGVIDFPIKVSFCDPVDVIGLSAMLQVTYNNVTEEEDGMRGTSLPWAQRLEGRTKPKTDLRMFDRPKNEVVSTSTLEIVTCIDSCIEHLCIPKRSALEQ
jgi:hypothetical protein